MKQSKEVEQNSSSKVHDPEKIMLLVGFGKKDLAELVTLIQAGQENEVMKYSTNVPPRWRRMAICNESDINNMRIYTEFLAKKLSRRPAGL